MDLKNDIPFLLSDKHLDNKRPAVLHGTLGTS